MVSSLIAEPVTTTSPSTSLKATAPEFRLLGLRPREARLEVIRRALTETAGDVKASERGAAEDKTAKAIAAGASQAEARSADGFSGSKSMRQADSRLAEVAIAGYRLLDPRRRRTLFERVQLLLWTEDDLDGVTGTLWDVARTQHASVKTNARPAPAATTAVSTSGLPTSLDSGAAKPSEAAATPRVEPVTRLAEETQAALDVFRTLRRRDRRATALWISVAALAISLPGAVALVLALV